MRTHNFLYAAPKALDTNYHRFTTNLDFRPCFFFEDFRFFFYVSLMEMCNSRDRSPYLRKPSCLRRIRGPTSMRASRHLTGKIRLWRNSWLAGEWHQSLKKGQRASFHSLKISALDSPTLQLTQLLDILQ